MNNLSNNLRQKFIESYPHIKMIYPQYCMVEITRCQYDGEEYPKNDIDKVGSLFFSNIRGIFIYNRKHKELIPYSQTLDLISNLAVPSEWALGLDLPEGYKSIQIRLSRNVVPGKIIICGIFKIFIREFLCDDLNEKYRELFRQAIKDKEWPLSFPKELKEYFKDLKK